MQKRAVDDSRLAMHQEEAAMFSFLYLMWLESILFAVLGKHNAYRNLVLDAGVSITIAQKIKIAKEILAVPDLEYSQRWHEYIRLKNRGKIPL